MQHAHVGPQGMLQQSNQSTISNKDQALSTAACMLHMSAQYEQLWALYNQKHAISQKIQDSQTSNINTHVAANIFSVFQKYSRTSLKCTHPNASTQKQDSKLTCWHFCTGFHPDASRCIRRCAESTQPFCDEFGRGVRLNTINALTIGCDLQHPQIVQFCHNSVVCRVCVVLLLTVSPTCNCCTQQREKFKLCIVTLPSAIG